MRMERHPKWGEGRQSRAQQLWVWELARGRANQPSVRNQREWTGHLLGSSGTVVGNWFPQSVLLSATDLQSDRNSVCGFVCFFDHALQNLSIYVVFICECVSVEVPADWQQSPTSQAPGIFKSRERNGWGSIIHQLDFLCYSILN